MPKPKPRPEPEREHRIDNEAVVDAYGPEERALGWYYYLDERISAFRAKCVVKREISPLGVGEQVEVLGMASEDECEHDMFVRIRWGQKKTLAVPLAQLKVVNGDDDCRQAVEDWLYWVRMGYLF